MYNIWEQQALINKCCIFMQIVQNIMSCMQYVILAGLHISTKKVINFSKSFNSYSSLKGYWIVIINHT